jgi:ribose transport system ATP-binding protein
MNSLLHVANIGKTFSGVRVLRDVSFTLSAGEVLGVVGENGAGKSTLVNILAGVHQPDTGTLTLDGLRYLPLHPADAVHCGVALVHQELNIFPNLTVAENIFLSGFPCRRVLGLQLLDRTAMKRRAGELLKRLDLATSPDTPVERLSQGERQLVEIAKALHSGSRVIIFDEPTTSLTWLEAARLFAQIQRLRGGNGHHLHLPHGPRCPAAGRSSARAARRRGGGAA